MTFGQLFSEIHPDVKVKDNRTCVWLYSDPKYYDVNHYTFKADWWNTEIKERPEIVRCKDCIHRGNAEKCILAAISKEKDFPLFILDNRGDWFCADGERQQQDD